MVHWFLAHLGFDELPAGPFFRVVRSKTPPGVAVDEIASRRPYDAPGAARFWYRLLPLEEAIVHKTHIVYPLNDAKMQRLSDLFLTPAWEPTALPSYGDEAAANPFIAFAAIPSRSRYQFLLDNAQYFVMTFIRGPVCRGQVAVDVIDDHFFVTFLDPDHDPSVLFPAPLPEVAFLRVRAAAATQADAVYSLIHNRAHTNVAYMFGEQNQLIPADDTLTVTRGTLGSYPNFMFNVEIGEIEAFTAALLAVGNPSDLEQVVTRWGLRRTSPRFWSTIDWLHDDFRRRQPAEVGLFDLNRYVNL